MPSGEVRLAAANGASPGTIITSSKRLAVRRWSLAKIAEDAAKFLSSLFDFQIRLTSRGIRVRNFPRKLPVKTHDSLVGRIAVEERLRRGAGERGGKLS
jgi:hypothetical protein